MLYRFDFSKHELPRVKTDLHNIKIKLDEIYKENTLHDELNKYKLQVNKDIQQYENNGLLNKDQSDYSEMN